MPLLDRGIDWAVVKLKGEEKYNTNVYRWHAKKEIVSYQPQNNVDNSNGEGERQRWRILLIG